MEINNHYLNHPFILKYAKLGISSTQRETYIKEAYKLGDSMKQSTNVKAIMSTYHVWEESKVFDSLFHNIMQFFSKHIPTPPNHQFHLVDAWTAIYKQNHYTRPHTHETHHSFVYYLKTTPNSPLIFDKCNFSITPEEDLLVVFPGYVSHSVPKNLDEQDRICIAGNVIDAKPNTTQNN